MSRIEPLGDSVKLPEAAPQPAVEVPASPIESVPRDPDLVMPVAAEFSAAGSALAYAGSLGAIDEVSFGRSRTTRRWWVLAESRLAIARELIHATRGTAFVEVDGDWLADSGWGDEARRARAGLETRDPSDVVPVDVLELVRATGLRPHARPPAEEIAVLVPNRRLTGAISRALDLGLDVEYQAVRMESLFGGADAPSVWFDLRLRSRQGPLPAAFLRALDRDPSVLPCRTVGERLLIQHGMMSALPDLELERIVASRESQDRVRWLFAEPAYGSARVLAFGELRDGSAMVRLADYHDLTGLDEGWVALDGDADDEPRPPALRLAPALTRRVHVDAALIDDTDLRCLPLLLKGERLADIAFVVRGRNRHLVTAPGGLLERLAVGVPLYRIGPGPLYLPVGFALRPALPPSAREALFGARDDHAVVLESAAMLTFDLATRRPVWTLWAGEIPAVDGQLPDDTLVVLREWDARHAPDATRPTRKPRRPRTTPVGSRPPSQLQHGRTWRDEALEAELAGDLVLAAELHEHNGEVRRAAHLYERASHSA